MSGKPRALFFPFVLLAVVLLTAGCAPTYLITVDAITGAAAPAEKDYFLLPGMSGINSNDLHFKEYSSYVNALLAEKGYRQVSEKEKSRLLIYLSYGVGTPQPTFYGRLVAAAPSKSGTAAPADADDEQSYVVRPGMGWPDPPPSPGFYRGFPYHRFHPGFYPGSMDYANYYQPVEIYPLFHRYLVLEAVDYQASRKAREIIPVWKVTLSNWGESADLRQVFPVLAAAAGDYIGVNTGKEVELSLSGNDVRVEHLKNLR